MAARIGIEWECSNGNTRAEIPQQVRERLVKLAWLEYFTNSPGKTEQFLAAQEVGGEILMMTKAEYDAYFHNSLTDNEYPCTVYTGRWSSCTYGFVERESPLGSSKFVLNVEMVSKTQKQIKNGIWMK